MGVGTACCLLIFRLQSGNCLAIECSTERTVRQQVPDCVCKSLFLTLSNQSFDIGIDPAIASSEKIAPLNHCLAVRMFFGTAPGALVRQGLMSKPPRRV